MLRVHCEWLLMKAADRSSASSWNLTCMQVGALRHARVVPALMQQWNDAVMLRGAGDS